MPVLTILYWNIENLGTNNNYRTSQARLGFITAFVRAIQPDIICIQEVKQDAITGQYPQDLLRALNGLPAPLNNWHYDWIKGALNPQANGGNVNNTYPYATAADLDFDAGHHEGYALFWNQNIAKFIMQPAPPIQAPAAVAATPNAQSETCRMMGSVTFGVHTYPLPQAVPAGGIVVPNVLQPYSVPAGTVTPGNPATLAATPTAAGTVLPAGTVIGPAGVTLSAQTNAVYPVVVPGGFTLTDALALPANPSVVVPEHALGLVMFGRDSSDPNDANRAPSRFNGNIASMTDDFQSGGGNYWNWIEFTRSAAGSAFRTGSRRPAYVTIRVNRPGHLAAADQLVPIIVYHAPSKSPASSAGMQRSAYSQPMYQAYDTANGAWVNCNNAVIGGDFNVVMNSVQYAYNAFALGWAGGANGMGGGANATMAVANGGGNASILANKSMASITDGFTGPPLYSATLSDYRQAAIDNVFYRGMGGGVVASIPDLLVATALGGGMNGGPVQGCMATPSMQAAANAGRRGITVPNMIDPMTSCNEIFLGAFGNLPNYSAQDTWARRCAEFVHLFVSDHLPVTAQFNL